MIRKLFFILSILVWYSNAQAQISDGDAILLYRQAEEKYNETDYYGAAESAYRLAEQMGAVPKVLYLYIKSIYKSYSEQEQKSKSRYKETYDNFANFTSVCTTFFNNVAVIGKEDYPPEKYAEIQDIHQWFNNQKEKYAYQKDRKPQDAIDFLNECAKKFNIKTWSWKFELYGKWLKMEAPVIPRFANFYKKKHGSIIIETKVYFFNLAKIIAISDGNFEGKMIYMNGKKYSDYFFEDSKTLTFEEVKVKESAILERDLKEKWQKRIDSLQKPETNFYSENVPNFLSFFNITNEEFKDGNYAKRIIEALQFLIDSAPKEKKPVEEQHKSKF